MKYIILFAILCNFLWLISSCKKESENTSLTRLDTTDATIQLSAMPAAKPITVITMAGKPNIEGYKDGVGDEALFKSPIGIELANDGSLFVADTRNNKIRKVTQSSVVTTLGVPSARDGSKLVVPLFCKAS